MPETTKYKLPYPSSSSAANVPADVKALAERSESLFGAVDLSQLVAGSENNGKLVVVSAGAAAYKAMSGDVTMDSSGVTAIGAKKVTTSKLEDKAVTGAKIDDAALTEAKLTDGAVSSRKLKPTLGYVQATAVSTALESNYKDIPGAKLEITPPVASMLMVIATFALNCNPSAVGAWAQGCMNVDGVDQPRVASWGQGGSTTVWLEIAITQSYLYPLTAGAHTIKMRAHSGNSSSQIDGDNTGFLYALFAS